MQRKDQFTYHLADKRGGVFTTEASSITEAHARRDQNLPIAKPLGCLGMVVSIGVLLLAAPILGKKRKKFTLVFDETGEGKVAKSWARDYECCIECQTTKVAHAGHGLCYNCYHKMRKHVR